MVAGIGMAVHRVIFRLDFDPAFAMINVPGTILKSLSETVPDYFSEFSHETSAHKISGKFQDDVVGRSITIEPSTIVLEIKSKEPIKLLNFPTHQHIKPAVEIITALCSEFKIGQIKRSGLRCFYFFKIFTDRGKALSAFQKAVQTPLIEIIKGQFGEIKDYGITFQGSHPDKLNYRCMVGPYLDNEAEKYLPAKYAKLIEEQKYDFTSDLHIYEKDFNLAGTPLPRWLNAVSTRMKNSVEATEKYLVEVAA